MRSPTPFEFQSFTAAHLTEVEPWFDDRQTQRYLGDRQWPRRALVLMRTAAGVEFRGQRVVARHVWVVRDDAGLAVALIDVETYGDSTGGLALVVAPARRGGRVAVALLRALDHIDELRIVQQYIGAVEPENVAARRAMANAGFSVATEPDAEGMLSIVRARGA